MEFSIEIFTIILHVPQNGIVLIIQIQIKNALFL